MCQYPIIGVLILLLGHISASLASYEDLSSLEVSDASSSASASYEAKEYQDDYKAAPVYRRNTENSYEDGVPLVLPQLDDTVAYWESIYGTDDVPEFEEPPVIEGETIFMDMDDLVEDEDPETIQVKRNASPPRGLGEDFVVSRPSGDADYQTRMASTNRPEFYDAKSLGDSESSTALKTDKDGQVYGSEDSASAVFSSSFNHGVKSTQRSESSSAVGMRASLDIDNEMESALESPEAFRAPWEARSIRSNMQIEPLGNSKRKIMQAKKDLVSLAASGASEAEIAEAMQRTVEAKQDLIDSVIFSTISTVQSRKAFVDSLATDTHQRKCCSTTTRSQSRSRNSSRSVLNSTHKRIQAKKDLLDSITSPRTESVDGDDQELGSAPIDFGLNSFWTENYQGNSQINSNVESHGSLQSTLDLNLKVLQAKGELIRTIAEGGSQEEIDVAIVKTLEAKKDLLESVVSIGTQAVDNGATLSTVLDIGLDNLLNEDDQVISLVITNRESHISFQTVLELKRKLIRSKRNLIRIAAARGSKSELIDALVKTLAAKRDLLNSILPAELVNLGNEEESASPSICFGLDTILNSDHQQNGQISANIRSSLDSRKQLIQAQGNCIKTALTGGKQSELNNAFLEILEAKRDLLNSVLATGAQTVDNGETISVVLDIGFDSLLNEDDDVISKVVAHLQSRLSLQTVLQLKQKLIEAKGNLIRTVAARDTKLELTEALFKTLAAKKDLLNSISLVNFDDSEKSASSSIDLGLDTILSSDYQQNGKILADFHSILDSKKKLIQAKGNLIETAVAGGNQPGLNNSFLETLNAKQDLVDSMISPSGKTGVDNEKDSTSGAIDLGLDSFSNENDQAAAPILLNLRPQSSYQSRLDAKRKRIDAKKNSSYKTTCENGRADLSEVVTKTPNSKQELLDTTRSTGTCRATKKYSNAVRKSTMDSSSNRSFKNEGKIVHASRQKNQASRQSVSNSKRKIIQATKNLIQPIIAGGSETEFSEAFRKTLDAKKELLDSATSTRVEIANNARDSCRADSLQSLINLKRKLIQTKKGLLDTVTTGNNAAKVNDALIKALNAKEDLIDSIISQNDGDLVPGLTIQSEVDASSTLRDLNLSGKLNSQTEVTGETTTIQNEENSVQSTSTGSNSIIVEGEIGISSSSNSINRGNDMSTNVNKKIQTDDQDAGDLQGSLSIGYNEDNFSASTGSLELSGKLSGEVEITGGTTKIQGEGRLIQASSSGSSNVAVEGEIGISSSSNAINQGNGTSLNVNNNIQTDGQALSDLQGSLTIDYSRNDYSTSSGSCELSGELDDEVEITGGTTNIQGEGYLIQSSSSGSSNIAVEGEIGIPSSSSAVNQGNNISLSVNKNIQTDGQASSDLQGSLTIKGEGRLIQTSSSESSNIAVEGEIGISSSSNAGNQGNGISLSVQENIQTDGQASSDSQGSLAIGYTGNDFSTSSGSNELSGELDDDVEVTGGMTKIQGQGRLIQTSSSGSSNIAVRGEIGISSSSNISNQENGISLSVNKNIQTDGQTSSDLQGSLTMGYSRNDSLTSSESCELSGEVDGKLGNTSGTTKIENRGSSLQSSITGASSVGVSSSSSFVESSSQISLTANKEIKTNAQISRNLHTNLATKQNGGTSEALKEEAVNVVMQESLENASSSSENSGKKVSEPTNVEIASSSSSELSGSFNTKNHSSTNTATSNSGIESSVELGSSFEAKTEGGSQLIDSECALGQCGVSGKLHVNLNAGSAINVQSEIFPAVCLAEPTLSLNLQDEDQILHNTEIELQEDVEQQELIQEGNNEYADEHVESMPDTNGQLLTSDNDNQSNIGRTYYGENTQYSTGGGIFSNAHHRLINLDVNCTGKTAFMNPECQQLNANLGHPRDSSMSITLRTVKTYLSHGQELAQEMQNRAKWLCEEGFIPKLHTPAMLHLLNSLATENTVEISQKSEFSLFGTKLLQRRLSSDFDVTPNTFLEFLQHHAFRVIGTGLCYVRPKRCPTNQMYRTFDGSCNNQKHPTWGQTNTAFARVLQSRYSDGVHEPPKSVTGEDLPNPRLLSVQCFSQNGVSDRRLTLAVAQWGQLLAHDTAMQTPDQTAKGGIRCCADGKQLSKSLQHHSCLPIEIPKNDEFYSRFGSECMEFVRSMTVSREDCSLGPAEQINTVSSYLDASQLYGSDKETADRLRAFEGGRLKVSIRRGRELPPVMTNRSRYCDVMSPSEVCYLAGDVRVNQVPHLTALQICLLREHNRIADELQRLNPHWEDERVFQETRKIVIAEYQHITYSEWLPVVIGKKYCQRYGLTPRNQGGMSRAYDPRVRATTINGFTTAAYRSFHSMLDGHIHLCPASREISHTLRLSNHYFRPQVIERNDNLDDLIRGLVTQPMQKSDINFDPEITEYLFRSRSEFGLDLESLDIQRGRDHGIPGYNRYREICGLTYATDFDDLRREIPLENINKLKKVYAHVDDIDLIVGAVMERKPPGSILGPIVRCLLGEQFYRSRIGDRYFYDNADQPHSFTPEQFEEIKKASLARLLCDTGDNIEEIQPEPFRLIAFNNPLTSCSALPRLDLSLWQETECS
ncbi:uncharacterized protein LOC124179644 [Neodiprion fabricii]|uniref:uncharacterized protein LOC124179644 n=1 Tax=Neodiprion fabricii TaxID=2872261 RepID=UPI001ED96624|nr:uncharacterized protein LOC124179644 [Neodiprion fabricii]